MQINIEQTVFGIRYERKKRTSLSMIDPWSRIRFEGPNNVELLIILV